MEKEKVLVSACLLGENCKYDGKNNYSSRVLSYLEDKEIIAVCPEVMGGLSVPRACVELKNGVAVNKNGEDVDGYFRAGVKKVLEKIEGKEISMAVLQPRSPSCGTKQVYDGSFTGRLIPGTSTARDKGGGCFRSIGRHLGRNFNSSGGGVLCSRR